MTLEDKIQDMDMKPLDENLTGSGGVHANYIDGFVDAQEQASDLAQKYEADMIEDVEKMIEYLTADENYDSIKKARARNFVKKLRGET